MKFLKEIFLVIFLFKFDYLIPQNFIKNKKVFEYFHVFNAFFIIKSNVGFEIFLNLTFIGICFSNWYQQSNTNNIYLHINYVLIIIQLYKAYFYKLNLWF